MQKKIVSPYKIGVTGTIASGKSVVGKFLSACGADVLDTDTVVSDLYHQNSVLKAYLKETFGNDIINNEGLVDKGQLRDIVFSNAQAKEQLESIVHPFVEEAIKTFFQAHAQPGAVVAVLVPLLFEVHSESFYDEVWTVIVEPETLLKHRLMHRDAMTATAAENRLAAQWPQSKKAALAQRIIDNSGDFEATQIQVISAFREIQEKIHP